MSSECKLQSLLEYKLNISIPPNFTGGETLSGAIIIDENNVITVDVKFPEQKVYTGGETADATVVVDENGVILVDVNYPEPVAYTGGETASGTINIDEDNVITLNVNHPDIPEQVYYYGGTSDYIEVAIDENNTITAELKNKYTNTEWTAPSLLLQDFEGDIDRMPRYRIHNDVLYLAGAITGGVDNTSVFEIIGVPAVAIGYTRSIVTQTSSATPAKLNIKVIAGDMVTLFAEVRDSTFTSIDMAIPLF